MVLVLLYYYKRNDIKQHTTQLAFVHQPIFENNDICDWNANIGYVQDYCVFKSPVSQVPCHIFSSQNNKGRSAHERDVKPASREEISSRRKKLHVLLFQVCDRTLIMICTGIPQLLVIHRASLSDKVNAIPHCTITSCVHPGFRCYVFSYKHFGLSRTLQDFAHCRH